MTEDDAVHATPTGLLWLFIKVSHKRDLDHPIAAHLALLYGPQPPDISRRETSQKLLGIIQNRASGHIHIFFHAIHQNHAFVLLL